MARKYKKEEILENISKWAQYLVETHQMTEAEINDILGEGLLTALGSKISDVAKKAVDGVKDAASNAAEAIHDAFLKNAGVKMFLDCIKQAKDSGVDTKELKMTAKIGSKIYPILDISIPKKFNKTLVLNINPEITDLNNCLTTGKLHAAIKAAGIKKMSAAINGIVCGTQTVEKKVNETSNVASSTPPSPEIPVFNFDAPVQATSGEKLAIADQNKLLKVSLDSKKQFIGFEFDKSKAVKKAEAEDDAIFS